MTALERLDLPGCRHVGSMAAAWGAHGHLQVQSILPLRLRRAGTSRLSLLVQHGVPSTAGQGAGKECRRMGGEMGGQLGATGITTPL